MNREHALPGCTAIVLAVLYPLYWLMMIKFGLASDSLTDAFRTDLERVDGWDALFVVIGIMEFSLYLSLRSMLKQHLDSSLATTLLMLMAIFLGIFTACVGFDVVMALTPGLAETSRETLLGAAMATTLSSGYILSWLGLILAVTLLVKYRHISLMLKLFALLWLVASILNVAILPAPLSVLFYPLAFLTLGLHFLRGEDEVEVV